LDFDEYVTASDTNAGYVEPDSASANTMIIGQALAVGTAGESCMVNLWISP
jgi:hypothetical protein